MYPFVGVQNPRSFLKHKNTVFKYFKNREHWCYVHQIFVRETPPIGRKRASDDIIRRVKKPLKRNKIKKMHINSLKKENAHHKESLCSCLIDLF
jgi:hypothetical protein